MKVAEEAVTPFSSVNPAPAVFAKQKGADLYPLPEKVNPQVVAAPLQVILPALLVELVFITGVVPHVPTVGVTPDEIINPPKIVVESI